MEYEVRSTNIKPTLGLRNNRPTISGMAISFYDGSAGSEFRHVEQGREVFERITRDSVERALERSDDILACLEHDEDQPLGRSPKTVKLSIDSQGLHYMLPNQRTTHYRNAVEMLKGDILRGSSFRFKPLATTWLRENGKDICRVDDMELRHISPVKDPAYKNSAALVRSADEYFRQLEETERMIEKTSQLWELLTEK